MFSVKLERSILLYRLKIRKRRLKLNKIFIGKPEFKHTNDKVVITLYIYNRELLILNTKIKKLKKKLIVEYFYKLLIKNKLLFAQILLLKNMLKKIDSVKKKIKNLSKRNIINKRQSYLKIKMFFRLQKLWDKFKINFNNRRKMFLAKSLKRLETKLDKAGSLNLNKKLFIYKYINNLHTNDNYIYNIITKSLTIIPKFNLSKLMYLKVLKKIIIKIRLYLRYNKVIFFNRSKFNLHIIPLKSYLEKLYNKQVEFNLVNIKNYNLDSNILTQIIAIKLKRKNNKIAKVIRHVFNKIKLPLTRKLQYKKKLPVYNYNQNLLIKQLINNKTYNVRPNFIIKSLKENPSTIINKLNVIEFNYDKLDIILKLLYPVQYTISRNKKSNILLKRNFDNTSLDTISNKIISGIRIETSGRLNKRVMAAKTISVMKQKGTIKNINSSYKKLSSVLLRGNFKSNLQFSVTNNKTRIGAFGVKGWISSI